MTADTERSVRRGSWWPGWLLGYRAALLPGDLLAGLIVTVMLIPQSLAYAMLAGLPPEMGLYASILPLIAYACLGSSMTLAVGPVAVASLMTASALGPLAEPGTAAYVTMAMQLALLSGLLLWAAGMLRLGVFAHFLSHPVISGFISGAAVLIALGQFKPLLGLSFAGQGVPALLQGLWTHAERVHGPTAAVGGATLALLVFARVGLPATLMRLGLSGQAAALLARLTPMVAVLLGIVAVQALDLDTQHGVAVVGAVPGGLPPLQLLWPTVEAIELLWLPAVLISLVGFVESVSVAQSLAHQRRQRIDPDRELLGLGGANLASAFSGGYPVTGGFARSVVNFAAGANTPLAGVVSAGLMALVLLGLTGLFAQLPHAVLAATIIVAVLALIDLKALRETWRYDRADAVALLVTLFGVLLLGVEAGIVLGVVLSLAALVWRSSRPHMAVVGRVPGTEHYRNRERMRVDLSPGLLALRIDESLFFANASALEVRIEHLLQDEPDTRELLLILSAVNRIDSTALGVLDELEQSLGERGVRLSLAEVKGPVMDRLRDTPFGQRLQGRVYLSTHEAFEALGANAPRGA